MVRSWKPSALSIAIWVRSRNTRRETTTLTRNAATARKIAGITMRERAQLGELARRARSSTAGVAADRVEAAVGRELAIDRVEHAGQRRAGLELEARRR